MINAKLMGVLNTLQEKKQKDFLKRTLASHSSKGVQSLSAYLLANKFKKNRSLSEKAFFKHYKKPFNNRELSNIMYEALKVLEEYLIVDAVRDKRICRDYLLALIYKENGNRNSYFEKLKKAKKEIQDQKPKDIWNLATLLHLHHMEYYTHHTQKLKGGVKINDCMDALDEFIAAAKVKYGTELKNCSNILNTGQQPILPLESAKAFLNSKQGTSKPPFTQGYLLALEMMTSPETGRYEVLKSWLLENHLHLTQEDRHALLIYLLNYCASMSKKGFFKKYGLEMLNLTLFGIDEKILTLDGHLTPTKFINFIETCCLLGEQGKRDAFIKEYEKKIPESERENTMIFVQARILFQESKFGEALSFLIKIKTNNLYIDIRHRELQIRCFYECYLKGEEYYGLIEAACESFRKFLSYNSLLERKIIEACRNFVKAVLMLLYRRKNKEKMLDTLNGFEQLHFKAWLIEKI